MSDKSTEYGDNTVNKRKYKVGGFKKKDTSGKKIADFVKYIVYTL